MTKEKNAQSRKADESVSSKHEKSSLYPLSIKEA
jgi:hypothetical protein